MTTEIITGFKEGFFIFFSALFYALIEIEIEGKEGWAKNLPTARNIIGKMTLYHVLMLVFIIIMFIRIYPMYGNNSFITIFYTTSWFLLEDFLWFVLNPYYTLKNYKKEKIWWHSNQSWIVGIPFHNFMGFILLLGCIYFKHTKVDLLISTSVMLISTLFVICTSSIYHKFYNRLHDNDSHES